MEHNLIIIKMSVERDSINVNQSLGIGIVSLLLTTGDVSEKHNNYRPARTFKNLSSLQESLLLSPLVAIPLVVYVTSLFCLTVTIISYLAIK